MRINLLARISPAVLAAWACVVGCTHGSAENGPGDRGPAVSAPASSERTHPAFAADDIFLAPPVVRVATYNVSLHRSKAGELVADLRTGKDAQAARLASVIQHIRPDVLLLNEFDFDAGGEAADLFCRLYLGISQGPGLEPLVYPHRFLAASNTGIPSGHDLDRSGQAVTEPGSRLYGNDCFGYGEYPGQYAMLLLSRHPILHAHARTFRLLRWSDMPSALRPMLPGPDAKPGAEPWHTDAAWAELRLSSKSHWDVPVLVQARPAGWFSAPAWRVVHILASHPTPPAFDGPERRNVLRNHDEIRFWVDYLSPGKAGYIRDDQGRTGGLAANAAFVIVGDLNADPADGSGLREGIGALLRHQRVNAGFVPVSLGGPEAARLQGQANQNHKGDPAADTADFSDARVGNLRVDYALPSANLRVLGGAVFWPPTSDPAGELVGMEPSVMTSDHRMVYVDVLVETAAQTAEPPTPGDSDASRESVGRAVKSPADPGRNGA